MLNITFICFNQIIIIYYIFFYCYIYYRSSSRSSSNGSSTSKGKSKASVNKNAGPGFVEFSQKKQCQNFPGRYVNLI